LFEAIEGGSGAGKTGIFRVSELEDETDGVYAVGLDGRRTGRGGLLGGTGDMRGNVGVLFEGLRLLPERSMGGTGGLLLLRTCMTRSLPKRSSVWRVIWATLLAWSDAWMSGLTRFERMEAEDDEGMGGGALRGIKSGTMLAGSNEERNGGARLAGLRGGKGGVFVGTNFDVVGAEVPSTAGGALVASSVFERPVNGFRDDPTVSADIEKARLCAEGGGTGS
jgi:hypothetical protein